MAGGVAFEIGDFPFNLETGILVFQGEFDLSGDLRDGEYLILNQHHLFPHPRCYAAPEGKSNYFVTPVNPWKTQARRCRSVLLNPRLQ